MCRGSFLIELNGIWISAGKELAFVLKGYQKQQEDLFPNLGVYQTPTWHSWRLRSNLQLGYGRTCSAGFKTLLRAAPLERCRILSISYMEGYTAVSPNKLMKFVRLSLRRCCETTSSFNEPLMSVVDYYLDAGHAFLCTWEKYLHHVRGIEWTHEWVKMLWADEEDPTRLTIYTGIVEVKIMKPSFKTLKAQFHAPPWKPTNDDIETDGSCLKLSSYNIIEGPAESGQSGACVAAMPVSLSLQNPVDVFDPTDPNRITCWEEYRVLWDPEGRGGSNILDDEDNRTRVNAWELELAEGRRMSRQEARDQEYYLSLSDAGNSSEEEDLGPLEESEDDSEQEVLVEKRGRGRPRGSGRGRGKLRGVSTGQRIATQAPVGVMPRVAVRQKNSQTLLPFCCICLDGGNVELCRGPCGKSYHKECVPLEGPGGGGSNQDRSRCWTCPSCTSNKVKCEACGGEEDASTPHSNIHKCSQRGCGRHYHEECLKSGMPGVKVLIQSGQREPSSSISLPSAPLLFICPSHLCQSCGLFGEPELYQCWLCPRAYHVSCVPSGYSRLKPGGDDRSRWIWCPNCLQAHRQVIRQEGGDLGLQGVLRRKGPGCDPGKLKEAVRRTFLALLSENQQPRLGAAARVLPAPATLQEQVEPQQPNTCSRGSAFDKANKESVLRSSQAGAGLQVPALVNAVHAVDGGGRPGLLKRPHAAAFHEPLSGALGPRLVQGAATSRLQALDGPPLSGMRAEAEATVPRCFSSASGCAASTHQPEIPCLFDAASVNGQGKSSSTSLARILTPPPSMHLPPASLKVDAATAKTVSRQQQIKQPSSTASRCHLKVPSGSSMPSTVQPSVEVIEILDD
ncbi:hypothetical protein CEUSTIGMA_g1701.t1 [Chlamydomonas eustigma]|uniref:PHD-type domain-containing protein n=1 Tax=Chlamydomonas eustigma TaxID=1157962 RepID=A0A250WUD5_9CHLO|nr:hypothetical protein CEUSTIGMA_g1701.t1 [Chlamydomonas eustigma]|eukprot:GAX74252.1 hypothetical protein CEUSTIGMA_g1701.t1 [Chlamydomonas eustigma]